MATEETPGIDPITGLPIEPTNDSTDSNQSIKREDYSSDRDYVTAIRKSESVTAKPSTSLTPYVRPETISRFSSSPLSEDASNFYKSLSTPFDIDEYVEGGNGKDVQLFNLNNINLSYSPVVYQDAYNEKLKRAIRERQQELYEDQTMLEAGANIFTKFIAKVGSNIVGQIGGFLESTYDFFEKGFSEGVWQDSVLMGTYGDNTILEGVSDFQEDLESALPVYATPDYHKMGFWRQVWTNPFKVGDEIADAAAFTVAAIASVMLTKGLGGLLRGRVGAASIARAGASGAQRSARKGVRGFLSNSNRASKGARTIKPGPLSTEEIQSGLTEAAKSGGLAGIVRGTVNVGKGVGRLAYGSWYEAAIEARETSDRIYEGLLQNYVDEFGKEPSEEQKKLMRERSYELSDTTFYGNMAILSLSELVTFPKIFMKGFRRSRNLRTSARRAQTKDIVADETGKLSARFDNVPKWRETFKYVGKAVARPLSEGVEEFSQGIISDANTEYALRKYSAGDNLAAIDYATAFSQSAMKALESKDAWKQFFIGAILGGAGVPLPLKINADGTAALSRPRLIGGSAEAIRDYNRYKQRTRDLIDGYANNTTQEVFKSHVEHFATQATLEQDMEEAASSGDTKTWKDREFDSFFDYVRVRQRFGTGESVKKELERLKEDKEFLKKTSEKVGYDISKEIDKAIERTDRILKQEELVMNAVDKKGIELDSNLEDTLIYLTSSINNKEERSQEILEKIEKELSSKSPEIYTRAMDYLKLLYRNRNNGSLKVIRYNKEVRESTTNLITAIINSKGDLNSKEVQEAAEEASKRTRIEKEALIESVNEDVERSKNIIKEDKLTSKQEKEIIELLENNLYSAYAKPELKVKEDGTAKFNMAVDDSATTEELQEIIDEINEQFPGAAGQELETLLNDYLRIQEDIVRASDSYKYLFSKEGSEQYKKLMKEAEESAKKRLLELMVERAEQQQQEAAQENNRAKAEAAEAEEEAAKGAPNKGDVFERFSPNEEEESGAESYGDESDIEIIDRLLQGYKERKSPKDKKDAISAILRVIYKLEGTQGLILQTKVARMLKASTGAESEPDTYIDAFELLKELAPSRLDSLVSNISIEFAQYKNKVGASFTPLPGNEKEVVVKEDPPKNIKDVSPLTNSNNPTSKDDGVWINNGDVEFVRDDNGNYTLKLKDGKPVERENNAFRALIDKHPDLHNHVNNQNARSLKVVVELDKNDLFKDNEQEFAAKVFAITKEGEKVFLGLLPATNKENPSESAASMRKELWEKSKKSTEDVVAIEDIEIQRVSHGYVLYTSSRERKNPETVLGENPLILIYGIKDAAGNIETVGGETVADVIDLMPNLSKSEKRALTVKYKKAIQEFQIKNEGYVYMLVPSASGSIVPVRVFTEKVENSAMVNKVSKGVIRLKNLLFNEEGDDKYLKTGKLPEKVLKEAEAILAKLSLDTSHKFSIKENGEIEANIPGFYNGETITFTSAHDFRDFVLGSLNRINRRSINNKVTIKDSNGNIKTLNSNVLLARRGVFTTWIEYDEKRKSNFAGAGYKITRKKTVPVKEKPEEKQGTDNTGKKDFDPNTPEPTQKGTQEKNPVPENKDEDNTTPEDLKSIFNPGGKGGKKVINNKKSDEEGSESDGRIQLNQADGTKVPLESADNALKWIFKVLGKKVGERTITFRDEQELRSLMTEENWESVKRLLKKGRTVMGAATDAAIYLRDSMEKGTQYHEAFHIVMGLFFTEQERLSILDSARKEYSEETEGKDDYEVEEILADKFQERMVTRESKPKTIGRKILDFFNKIIRRTQLAIGLRKTGIENIFRNIELGVYKNKIEFEPLTNSSVVKLSNRSSESPKFSSIKDEREAKELVMFYVDRFLKNAKDKHPDKTNIEILGMYGVKPVFNHILNDVIDFYASYVDAASQEGISERDKKIYVNKAKKYLALAQVLSGKFSPEKEETASGDLIYKAQINTSFGRSLLFQLKNIGINIDIGKIEELSESNIEQEEDLEIMNNEDQEKENWQTQSFYENNWLKIPQKVRHAFARIPIYDKFPPIKDSSDESLERFREEAVVKKNTFNSDMVDNFGEPLNSYHSNFDVYRTLTRRFHGLYDSAEFVEALKQAIPENPIFYDIWEKVKDHESDQESKELLDLIMYSVVQNDLYTYVKGIVTTSGSVITSVSNRMTPAAVISQNMNSYFHSKMNRMMDTGVMEIKEKESKEFISGYNNKKGLEYYLESFSDDSISDEELEKLLRPLSELLRENGFDINENELKRIYNDIEFATTGRRSTARNRVLTLLNNINDLHKNFISKGVDPFVIRDAYTEEDKSDQEGYTAKEKDKKQNNINYIGAILAGAKDDKFATSFLNIENKLMQANVVPMDITYKLNEILGMSLEEIEELEKDPILEGNDILDLVATAVSKEELEKIKILVSDGIQDSTNNNRISEYASMSLREKAIYDYAMFMSRGLVRDKAGNTSKEFAPISFPTPGDASRLPYITMRKYDKDSFLSKLVEIAGREANRIKKVKQLKEEYKTATEEEKKSDKFKLIDKDINYGKNGERFLILPILNDVMLDENGNVIDLNSGDMLKTVEKALYDWAFSAEGEISQVADVLEAAGVITKVPLDKGDNESAASEEDQITGKDRLDTTVTPISQTLGYYVKLNHPHQNYSANSLEGQTEEFIEFVMSNFIGKTELITLFAGDPAFYKNLEDFYKRNKQSYTPTRRPVMDATFVHNGEQKGIKNKSFNMMVAKDALGRTAKETLEALEYIHRNNPNKDEIISGFNSNNKTDATLYVTPDLFRDFMIGIKKWDSTKEEALLKDNKGQKLGLEHKDVFNPAKPFLYSNIQIDGVQVPTHLKQAMFVLTKEIAYKKEGKDYKWPALKEMYDMMHNPSNPVHAIAYESAFKVGRHNVQNLNTTLHSGKPQDNANIYIDSEHASKERNNVYKFGEFSDSFKKSPKKYFTPENADYRSMKEYLEDLDKSSYSISFSRNDLEKFRNSNRKQYNKFKELAEEILNIDIETGKYIAKPEKLHTLPLKDMAHVMETPAKYEDKNILAGSQILQLAFADAETESQLKAKDEYHRLFEANFAEAYRNFIHNISYIDPTTNKKKINYDTLLRTLRDQAIKDESPIDVIEALEIINNEGRLEPRHFLGSPDIEDLVYAHVASQVTKKISLQKIRGASLINTPSKGYDKDLKLTLDPENGVMEMDVYLPWHMKGKIPVDKDGNIDMSKVSEDMLKIFGYRIPTEDKYSSVVMRIKGFTTPAAANQIILPQEITEIVGLDFDVDKLYVWFPEGKTDIDGVIRPIKYYDSKEQYREEIFEGIINSTSTLDSLMSSGIINIDRNSRMWAINKINEAKALKKEHKLEVAKERRALETVRKLQARAEQIAEEIKNSPDNDPKTDLRKLQLESLLSDIEAAEATHNEIKTAVEEIIENSEDFVSYLTRDSIDEELVKLIDMLIDAGTVEQLNVKKARNNRIIELVRNNIQDTNSLETSTSPTNFDIFKRAAAINVIKELGGSVQYNGKEATRKEMYFDVPLQVLLDKKKELLEKEEKYTSISSYAQDLQAMERNNDARKVIGISANTVVMNAKMQAEKIRSNKKVSVDGKEYQDFGVVRDGSGKRVLKDLSSAIPAATDNPKTPTLKDSGFTSDTIIVPQFLLNLGIDEAMWVGYLMINQPYIKPLIGKQFKENLRNYKKGLEEWARNNNVPLKSSKRILISTEVLESTIEKPEEEIDIQARYNNIDNLLKILEENSQLLEAIMASKPDRKGMPTTISENIIAFMKLREVKEKSKMGMFTLSGLNKVLEQTDPTKPMTISQASIKYGFENGTSLIGQVVPSVSENFVSLVDFFRLNKGDSPITSKEVTLIRKAFHTYIMMQHPFFREIENPKEFMTGFIDRFESFKSKYSNKNSENFNQDLEFILSYFTVNKDRNRVISLHSQADKSQKIDLRILMDRGLKSGDPEIQNFFRDMVRYQILLSGYRYSQYNAYDVIPTSFTREIMGEISVDGEMLVKSFHDMEAEAYRLLKSLTPKNLYKQNGYVPSVIFGPSGQFQTAVTESQQRALEMLEDFSDKFVQNYHTKYGTIRSVSSADFQKLNINHKIVKQGKDPMVLIVSGANPNTGKLTWSPNHPLSRPNYNMAKYITVSGVPMKLMTKNNKSGQPAVLVYVAMNKMGKDGLLTELNLYDDSRPSVIEENRNAVPTDEMIEKFMDIYSKNIGITNMYKQMTEYVEQNPVEQYIAPEPEPRYEEGSSRAADNFLDSLRDTIKAKEQEKEQGTTVNHKLVDKNIELQEIRELERKERTVFTSRGILSMRSSILKDNFGNVFTGTPTVKTPGVILLGTNSMDKFKRKELAAKVYKDWLQLEKYNKEDYNVVEDPNLSNQDGTKRLASSNENGIRINKVESLEEFFEYFEGKVSGESSAQKKVVLEEIKNKYGFTLDAIKKVIDTVDKANEFLVLHEMSHIKHGDYAIYWNNGRNLLTKDKIEIEARATYDALLSLVYQDKKDWIVDQINNENSELNKAVDNGAKLLYFRQGKMYYSHADALGELIEGVRGNAGNDASTGGEGITSEEIQSNLQSILNEGDGNPESSGETGGNSIASTLNSVIGEMIKSGDTANPKTVENFGEGSTKGEKTTVDKVISEVKKSSPAEFEKWYSNPESKQALEDIVKRANEDPNAFFPLEAATNEVLNKICNNL